MGVGRVHLHWQFDEEAWARVQTEMARPEPGMGASRGGLLAHGWRLSLWIGLVAALVYVVHASWVAPQREMRQSIAEQLQQEETLWLAADLDGLVSAVDPEARPEWIRWYRTHSLWRRNWASANTRLPEFQIRAIQPLDASRVLVTVRYISQEAPAYQEGIVFRSVGDRWLRTSPDPALWGVLYLDAAGPVAFEYRERDADAVEGLMSVVDTMLQRLHGRLPATDLLGLEGQRLHVVVHADPVQVRRSFFGERQLHLLSPHLDRRLAQDTPAQALSRSVATALAQQAAIRILPHYGYFDPRWGALYRGFVGWLARDINPLVEGSVPEDRGPLVRYVEQEGLPTLFSLRRRHQGYPWEASWMDLAAQSLFAYTLETYPVEDLQLLFRSAVLSVRWERWTQTTLGISAAEYEAGWHAYLQERWLQR